MKNIYAIIAMILVQGLMMNSIAVTVHTIGDSTMADYEENTTDKRGWGMMFQQFFTSDVTINNRAKSGASSKSFYEESPYWATVKTQIKSGDYVIIQFSHNDEKNGGLDGDTVRATTDPDADYRGTTAQGTFKKYLRLYVEETRALGATPILATSMCRKYFSGGTINRKGRHDLGENFGVPETDHTYDYSYALAEVATEMSVQLIDLTSLTKSLFESYGDAACTELLFCNDDSTHPNALGGTLVARLCAQEMSAQGILAEYINPSADILVNPTSHDFGNAYIGQTLYKEFTISGFDLDPASGIVTLSVTDGFSIASEKDGTYSSSTTLNYSNGNVDFTKFYVSVSNSVSGDKQGALNIATGSINKNIPLNSNFIELVGGTEVKVTWELSANDEYILSGPAMAVDESWSEMYAQRYAQPNSNTLTDSEKWDVSQRMQRNLLDGDVWPAGEVDEVSTRYVQFGITANEGTELNIDSIGMFVAGAGGNGMRCRISYSTNNFSDVKVIKEFSSMVANTVYEVSTIPVEKLTFGDTLKVRVYPWYSGEATGKTICLGEVCIHGMATNANGISDNILNQIKCYAKNGSINIENAPVNSRIAIYDLTGKLIGKTIGNEVGATTLNYKIAKGIYICQITSNKSYETIKFIVE